MQPAIFVSYRRDDAEGEAGRLYDDLARAFGADSVFIDVAGIAPGVDFRKAIDDNVAGCTVFLALIGPRWAGTASADGSRRLDNPNDFVRLEIASALTRNIPVIPILVHGAGMPTHEQLPENLRDLAYRNALQLSPTRWSFDVDLLIHALKPYIQIHPPAIQNDGGVDTPPLEPRRPFTTWLLRFTKSRVALFVAGFCVLLMVYPFLRYLSKPGAPLAGSTSQLPPARTTPPSDGKPLATEGADQTVAQIQENLADASRGSTPPTNPTLSKIPELPFRKGPPLVKGSINGTWISAARDSDSLASKIVISGTGRYRTLYVLGKCDRSACEWETPDADYVNGKLTDVHSDRDARIYFTMYLTSRGLFTHAERYSDQAKPGLPQEEEVGYYERASASPPVGGVLQPSNPTASTLPAGFDGTWLPVTPNPNSFASKIIISGTDPHHLGFYVWGEASKTPYNYMGSAVFAAGKVTVDWSSCSLGESKSRIDYRMQLTSKGLFVHIERHYDPIESGSQPASEEEEGYYRKAPESGSSKKS